MENYTIEKIGCVVPIFNKLHINPKIENCILLTENFTKKEGISEFLLNINH